MSKNIKLIFTTLVIGSSLLLSGCIHTQDAANAFTQGQMAYKQQNYRSAFIKLIKAANYGNTNAQYAVGYMLYNGIGIKRDQTTALIWLNKAAKKGNYRAIDALEKLNTNAEKQIYK